LPEFGADVYYGVGDTYLAGYGDCCLDILTGAAPPVLIPHFKGKTVNVEALLLEKMRGDRGIHAPAHSY
jgi:hypothetical protein